eukprot:tig00000204_g17760.t1
MSAFLATAGEEALCVCNPPLPSGKISELFAGKSEDLLALRERIPSNAALLRFELQCAVPLSGELIALLDALADKQRSLKHVKLNLVVGNDLHNINRIAEWVGRYADCLRTLSIRLSWRGDERKKNTYRNAIVSKICALQLPRLKEFTLAGFCELGEAAMDVLSVFVAASARLRSLSLTEGSSPAFTLKDSPVISSFVAACSTHPALAKIKFTGPFLKPLGPRDDLSALLAIAGTSMTLSSFTVSHIAVRQAAVLGERGLVSRLTADGCALRSLALVDCTLGGDEEPVARALLQAAAKTRLQSLDLSGSLKNASAQAEAVAECIRGRPGDAPLSLVFRRLDFDDDDAEVFAKAFRSAAGGLRSLDLYDNRVTDDGAQALVEAFAALAKKGGERAGALPERLDLGENFAEAKTLARLAALLATRSPAAAESDAESSGGEEGPPKPPHGTKVLAEWGPRHPVFPAVVRDPDALDLCGEHARLRPKSRDAILVQWYGTGQTSWLPWPPAARRQFVVEGFEEAARALLAEARGQRSAGNAPLGDRYLEGLEAAIGQALEHDGRSFPFTVLVERPAAPRVAKKRAGVGPPPRRRRRRRAEAAGGRLRPAGSDEDAAEDGGESGSGSEDEGGAGAGPAQSPPPAAGLSPPPSEAPSSASANSDAPAEATPAAGRRGGGRGARDAGGRVAAGGDALGGRQVAPASGFGAALEFGSAGRLSAELRLARREAAAEAAALSADLETALRAAAAERAERAALERALEAERARAAAAEARADELAERLAAAMLAAELAGRRAEEAGAAREEAEERAAASAASAEAAATAAREAEAQLVLYSFGRGPAPLSDSEEEEDEGGARARSALGAGERRPSAPGGRSRRPNPTPPSARSALPAPPPPPAEGRPTPAQRELRVARRAARGARGAGLRSLGALAQSLLDSSRLQWELVRQQGAARLATLDKARADGLAPLSSLRPPSPRPLAPTGRPPGPVPRGPGPLGAPLPIPLPSANPFTRPIQPSGRPVTVPAASFPKGAPPLAMDKENRPPLACPNARPPPAAAQPVPPYPEPWNLPLF